MRTIIALAAALTLAGCSTAGIRTADRPTIARPDSALLQSCALPSKLPPGEMTQRDIERYWGLDRKHQIECAKRHGALRDFVLDRDGRLQGKN